MTIIFNNVVIATSTWAPHLRTKEQHMEQDRVFAPIADPGQLAHNSASHSNALVENPFEDVDAAADSE